MSSEFADAAAALGRTIAADAIWYDGRCTWVGGFEDPALPWRAEYRALEADLYDGTAGIGLFLAHLAAVTGDAGPRSTAVGALRHATGRAARRDGLQAGSLGVAWAAACAAALLDEDELDAAARELAAAPIADGPVDVVFGCAGSALARSRWLSCSTSRASPAPRSPGASGCSPPRPSRRTAGPGRRRTRRAAGTSAACRTARRGSAGRCSSSMQRPATSGFAPALRARSSTSVGGSTARRAHGPICGSAASAAGDAALAGDRHVVPR